ncbi:MAG: EAL domain-containing protein [Phyllobacteriaceae bacterium]|nr:EAL domain-containing protein [Phyllobacteriaceae bacterium]
MIDLKARLAPSGRRSLSSTGERLVLFGIIAFLFVLDYSFDVLHGTVRILESTDSTLGSALLAIAVASWVGVFAYAFRRRFDITRILLAKAEAERNAETAGICDALTGLPNRLGLKAELAHRRREEANTLGALIALDVARFKTLNEVHGHLVADPVLIELSDRLAMAVSQTDFVARVGPDEFNVLTRVRDADAAELKALQIVHTIAMRLDEFDPPVPITADAGVTLFGGDHADDDVEVIMRRAEIALETAKTRESSVARFTEDMEEAIRERAELETALEAAIDGDQITPHFQPVIDLATGRLTGFEVLARWLHPTRGQIPPVVFIPIAEETGLLSRLTTKLLRQACLSARAWPPHIKIAVNISPVDFKNPWLAQEILQILTEVGFPPQRLEIEITESALVVDHDQATQTLMSLKNQGISIALDDFGTGYASLHQLRMLPFDKIKIDQSFVKTMRENTDSRMIVKAIIGLSGSLGLPTTAEGIENSGNADILRDLGCTLGQGFLYSEAVPAKAVPSLVTMIEAHAAPAAAASEDEKTTAGAAEPSHPVEAEVVAASDATPRADEAGAVRRRA